ncbi:hypothetical protein CY34DRAFT_352112 [Suillus luteus UH-Slu-Lm8-n1]|uniref:Uncharacterized protein n=1 Tax=Suillus luteus UH-Slu-Lm8-n1 TaxID=930992 RepID=A0A0C9ZN88_9AGAM|nr:hypothetical protein CY34DRAFT_352112 [Suillus luteus UH-Slu-Lm8-n1]
MGARVCTVVSRGSVVQKDSNPWSSKDWCYDLKGASQLDWPRLTSTQAEDKVANESRTQELWWR